jgi:hypothetical protein
MKVAERTWLTIINDMREGESENALCDPEDV